MTIQRAEIEPTLSSMNEDVLDLKVPALLLDALEILPDGLATRPQELRLVCLDQQSYRFSGDVSPLSFHDFADNRLRVHKMRQQPVRLRE